MYMRLWIWLTRICHCRGFGVQSPFAYHFITEIINECYPFYFYDRLKCDFPHLNKEESKLCRLYFRLVNEIQPASVLDYMPSVSAYNYTYTAACSKSKVATFDDGMSSYHIQNKLLSVEKIDFLRMSLDGDYASFFSAALGKTHQHSLFVIEGIHKNGAAKKFWKNLLANPVCGVTFDLYYTGIVFFDKSYYKQNYIVNF